MISFDNDEIYQIPKYIQERIALPISNQSNIIISCKFPWDCQGNIQGLLDSYISIKKTVFVFLISDKTMSFDIPQNVRLYRTSILKSTKQDNEDVLPYIWEPIQTHFLPLTKTEKPKIGFCGLNSEYRKKTLQILEENINLDTDFIIKEQFWGGSPHNSTVINDFETNIQKNHFTICNRGAGNFSMRFYQVLSCGRIPILLNTDSILPFEEEIDWDDIIVFGNTEEELVKKLLYFWNSKDIIEAQNRCYNLYQKYFSGTNYLDRIVSESI